MREAKSIPNSWAWTEIGEISETFAGYGFPKRLQGRKDGDLPFFKVGNISNASQFRQEYLSQADHYLTVNEAKSIKAKSLPPGTTVFAKIDSLVKRPI